MTINILILAGGLGTRMKSTVPKVMHNICGKPILEHIVDTSSKLNPERIILLIGNGSKIVKDYFETQYFKKSLIDFAYQKEQLGTGDALKSAVTHIMKNSNVIILSGDVPLIKKETIERLLKTHESKQNAVTVLTMIPTNPFGYGRMERDAQGNIKSIVEHKDANDKQKEIGEVNAGIYCIKSDFIYKYIDSIGNNNKQKEYYITDLISITHKNDLQVDSVIVENASEVLGINNRNQLAEIEQIMLAMKREEMMKNGVTMESPESIYIDSNVECENDVIIESNVVIKGKSIIKKGCIIKSLSYLNNVELKENTIIEPGSIIEK